MTACRMRTGDHVSPEVREQIRQLSLMDDDFMNVALGENLPCVEEMLRVILGKEDLIVRKAQTQRSFQGFTRSICLDVYAEDSQGTLYNIEIQRANKGANPRRARFHGAMMDSHALEPGQDFEELPERYVIFITQNDVLGLGQTLYTIHKYIDGRFLPFNDGAHILYVNGAAENDGTELWKLIHDLRCTEASEMFFPRLAARVRFLKDEEEGIVTMNTYFAEREKKAVEAAQESIAMRLIHLGKNTFEEIAACSGLALGRVQQLAGAVAQAS